MQDKTDLLNLVSAQTSININMNKTKIMKANTKSKNVVTVGGKPLEETDCFTYLGSKINKIGGTEKDTKARIQKARVAFLMMGKIWKSKLIKLKTNMRIFNSSVKSVLLYSSETWRITKHTVNKIQTFVNRCLRSIMNVKRSDEVSNNTLWTKTNQLPVEIEIKRRKWHWIGHTLRKPTSSITRQALTWNPQGKRKRGRPRNTWRRDVESEARKIGYTWQEIVTMAQRRIRWRTLIHDPCSQRVDGHK